uniref:Bromo domain-containing protein n=3 Tax=Timema TaxID=61471 RepID=A0A7R9NWH5_9NEOP|nr:unnamed protein product [Timema tahoe]
MGSKKHKKHKSEKKDKYEDKQSGIEKPPGLKLILKVGSSSTPEHSSDSPGPSIPLVHTNINYSVTPAAGDEESRHSSTSLHGREDSHLERQHKKVKKKKKKKEKDKDREKHEKKHKHHHKEKRKRLRDESSQDDISMGEESSSDPPLPKRMLDSSGAAVKAAIPEPMQTVASSGDPSVQHPGQAVHFQRCHEEINKYDRKAQTTRQTEPNSSYRDENNRPFYNRNPATLSPSKEFSSRQFDAGFRTGTAGLSGVLREPRSCVLRQRQERSALQKLLDYLLKGVEKRDPQQFFAWPVTDHIAPGYSQIIHHPMDFSTMKQKIDDNQYLTLNDFIEDFKLMCNNAMVYNHPETIYYKAAKKLLHVGVKMMSQDKLKPLRSVITYMVDISREELGFDLGYEEGVVGVKIEPEEEQEGGEDSQDTLEVKQEMGFLRQRKDGTTSLAIVVPNDGVTPGTNERPISLGVLCGKLTHGTGQLQGFREDRRNLTKTVKPLYYGAFGSYAPSYDSTFANLTKEESDLVYQTYGDETAVQYAESILDFSKDCDFTLTMVDDLLDLLTSGEHRKTKRFLEDRRKLREEEERIRQLLEGKPHHPSPPPTAPQPDVEVDYTALKSLADLGIDTSFIDNFGWYLNAEQELKRNEEQKASEEAVQAGLDHTSNLLQKLQQVQNDRLSMVPPPHLAHVVQPSDNEVHLDCLLLCSVVNVVKRGGGAEKITENLKDMAKKVSPGAIAPVSAVRKAMGVHPSSEPNSPAPAEEENPTSVASETLVDEVDVEGTSSQAEAEEERGEVGDVPDLESELREFLESEPALSNSPLHGDKTIEEILSESLRSPSTSVISSYQQHVMKSKASNIINYSQKVFVKKNALVHTKIFSFLPHFSLANNFLLSSGLLLTQPGTFDLLFIQMDPHLTLGDFIQFYYFEKEKFTLFAKIRRVENYFGKPTLNTTDRYSNLDLPVIGS